MKPKMLVEIEKAIIATTLTPTNNNARELAAAAFAVIEEHRHTTKLERKQQDTLNRIKNLVPGLKRIYEIERVATELRMEADFRQEENNLEPEVADRLRADALLLERIAWDLHEMRRTIRPVRVPVGRYDPEHWRGARP